MDALCELFDQVRSQRPPIHDGNAWQSWLCAIGECISALPGGRDARWAATVLVSDDLCRAMPGTPLTMAYLMIQTAVFRAGGLER